MKKIRVIHRHHGARAGSSHEDLGGIRIVLTDGPGHHVGDGVAVSSAVMGQSSLRADIPAGPAVGALGVDDNEAILLCQLCIGRSGVVCLGGASA